MPYDNFMWRIFIIYNSILIFFHLELIYELSFLVPNLCDNNSYIVEAMWFK